MLVIGLFLLALPIPEIKDLKLLGRAMSPSSPITLVGPSTIDTVSRCDRDTRTITDLLSAATGARVADLSDPGQPISDAINLAAVAGGAPQVQDVILPIAPAAIDEWTTPSYRKLLAFKAGFAVFDAASVGDFWSGLSLRPERAQRAYSFGAKIYPDYRTISATQFAREKRLAGCPEALTHDPAFTRSYYWWMYVAQEPNPALYQLVGELSRYLGDRGRRLHVVLLPLNLQLIRTFSPDWARIAAARQAQFAAALTARNVHVVNLSAALTMGQFITPWCACTHLSDQGRSIVADAVATDIRAMTAPSKLASASAAKPNGI